VCELLRDEIWVILWRGLDAIYRVRAPVLRRGVPEPEDMLEVRGFVYVATLFRPSREELTAAALRIVSVELDEPLRREMASWQAPASGLDARLVPAM